MVLKEYLLNILQLEVSLQDQQQAIAKAETALETISPKALPMPQKPKPLPAPENRVPTLYRPTPPTPFTDIMLFSSLLLLSLAVCAYAVWTIILLIDLLSTFGKEEWNYLYVLYLFSAAAISPVLAIWLFGRTFDNTPNFRIKAEKEQYRKAVAQYEAEKDNFDRKYEAALEQYKNDVAKQNKDYQKALNNHEQQTKQLAQVTSANKKTAQEAIAKMQAKKAATDAVLKQYYSLDIVHPKYRNISALALFCEYLDTGRCTALTGPNGAYNLYEQELRQDQIISKLDTVISKLEKIEQNQVMMLEQLEHIHRNSDTMTSDMKNLLSSTHRIEKLSSITAYCSAVTAINSAATAYFTSQIAHNTQDLKYIALGK